MTGKKMHVGMGGIALSRLCSLPSDTRPPDLLRELSNYRKLFFLCCVCAPVEECVCVCVRVCLRVREIVPAGVECCSACTEEDGH